MNSFDNSQKSYYKLARIYHPDKCSEANRATAEAMFNIIHQAYLILSNVESRVKYDEGDSKVLFAKATIAAEWENHLKVTKVNDIIDATASYKGSAEERAEILREFVAGNGSMIHILNTVPFTRRDDEIRMIEIIQDAIKNGEVQRKAIKKLPKSY